MIQQAIILGAVAAGIAIGAGFQQIRVSGLKADAATLRAEHANLVAESQTRVAAAEAEARRIDNEHADTERALRGRIDALTQEAADAQQDYKTRLAAADRSGASLRDQLTTLGRALSASNRVAASDTATIARQREAAREAARVLADLYRQSDDRAGILAQYADQVAAAGLTCQKAYKAAFIGTRHD